METVDITTRILVLSDTHGALLPSIRASPTTADVAIHCGDLTQHSLLREFEATIQLLKDTHAPLKLIIAGNHDFSLDTSSRRTKMDETKRVSQGDITDELLEREYGKEGAVRTLFDAAAREANVILLDEGTHEFTLRNGAKLRVYASPYTPYEPGNEGAWGFQYSGSSHPFNIKAGTDIVITHGPPHGIFDMAVGAGRIGCPALFAAVAKAKPRVHCFGHVHRCWGAKLTTWRPAISRAPSHFADIDHGKSTTIATLASLAGENNECAMYYRTSHCARDPFPLGPDQTLFVNAAVMGQEKPEQLPWLIDIELPRARANE